MAKTALEDTMDVDADQKRDAPTRRMLDHFHPHLGAIWQEIVVQAMLE